MKLYIEMENEKEKDIVRKYVELMDRTLDTEPTFKYAKELLEQGDRAEIINGDTKIVFTKGSKWTMETEYGPNQIEKMDKFVTTMKDIVKDNPDIVKEVYEIVNDYLTGMKYYIEARLLEKKMYGRYVALYKKVKQTFTDYIAA